MSHLGDRLSALVDGELGHDDRDRLLAHLAMCADCRAEATALRALKRRLAALGDTASARDNALGDTAPGDVARRGAVPGEATMNARLLGRLLALADQGAQGPARPRLFPAAPRPSQPTPAERPVPGGRPGGSAGPPRDVPIRPPGWGRPGRRAGPRRRSPYLLASVGLFVVVGIGGLSFAAGGAQPAPAPRITPAVDMFTVQHSVTTGEVSLTGVVPHPVVSVVSPRASRHRQP